MGKKSNFCLGLVQHAAISRNIPVAIFSLGMSKQQLVQRMLCSEASIDANRLRAKHLQTHDWTNLATAMGKLGEAPIYIDDSAYLNVSQITATVRELNEKNERLGLVIIDYIQLLPEYHRMSNSVEEISDISCSLKTLAREFHIPVIAVSQLPQAIDNRKNKRPMLSDLSKFSCINADMIMFLYRDDYYNPETVKRGEAEIIIAMQRNGPTGTVEVLYQSSTARFLNKIPQLTESSSEDTY